MAVGLLGFACGDGASSGACGPCDEGRVCRSGACVAPLDGGTCTASISVTEVTSAAHRPVGEPLTFATNPPAGGDHYPTWLRWARRHGAESRGHWVHNLEHGGVALLSPCPEGCEALEAELEALGRSLEQEALCRPPINARWVVVRDPLLPSGTAVAAAAWGWTFTAPCYDEAALRRFILERIGRGPEATCAEGSVP